MSYKFEVGMKVIVTGNAYQGIAIVEHVTPSGRARIGSTMYRADGTQIGGSKWYRYTIAPATPEQAEAIERKAAEDIEQRALSRWVSSQNFTLPELRAVKAAVEAVREAGA